MIKALVFDIGGVVLPFAEWQWHDQKWEAILNLEAGEIEKRIWSSKKASLAVTGQITFEEFMARLGSELGLSESQLAEWQDDQNSLVRYDQDLADWLKGLRPKYRIAFLSNDWSNGREENARLGLDELVDLMVISAEEGVAKPDPRIYELTLERLGVRASEAVYVDDRAEHVEAAAKLGMLGIVCKSPAQMMRDVELALGWSPEC